jgi:LacI family transcriptional regulator
MSNPPHVAVLIEASRAYGRGLLEGVARYVREQGPWSIYFKPQGLREVTPRWLAHWKGDGILARFDDIAAARKLRRTKIPVVDLRGRLPNQGFPFIGVDNAGVADLALRHLLERGFKHFAFCGLARGEHPHMDERARCFIAGVKKSGFRCSHFVPRPNLAWEDEQQELAAWTKRLPKPVGIMTCNDDRGQQLLDACRRANVQVPDEAAVIGVDNDTVLCGLSTPTLSSVDVNPQRIGYEAAALLAKLMAGRPAPRKVHELPPLGVVTRQSSDVLAITDRDVATAVRFIRQHACEGINVDDVLKSLPLSRSSLERRMKSALGRSPKEEILDVQIAKARQLLSDSVLPIKVVAQRAGFSTEKYFGDVFYRKTGWRAGAFRKHMCLKA